MTQALVDTPLRQAAVEPLPQLLEQESYNPNTLSYVPRADLKKSGQPTYPALEDWVEIFRHSIASFRRTAETDSSLPVAERLAAAERFAEAYLATVNAVEREALASSTSCDGSSGRQLGCLELCQLREEALRAAGFTDIFRQIKAKENSSALGLLRDVCAELDEHSEQRDRWNAVIRGVFAGNIFDLGCAATTDMYHQGDISFRATRDKLLPRPWVVDDLDALLDRLCRPEWFCSACTCRPADPTVWGEPGFWGKTCLPAFLLSNRGGQQDQPHEGGHFRSHPCASRFVC